MYEFVTEKNGEEFEKFMSESPYGNFLQASIWAGVKKEWDSRRIISRDDNGKVRAAMLLLIRRVPHLPFICSARSCMRAGRGGRHDGFDKRGARGCKAD